VTQEKPTEQWEMAFGNVLRKMPVHDLATWQIKDYKLQPLINNKIDGFAPDKVIFVRVAGQSLHGLGIKEGDVLKVVLLRDIVHNGVHIVDIGGKPSVRRLRKLDGDKVLLMEFDRENKTEIRGSKEVNVIGRCLSAEIVFS
jgi:phage repressor protein C with HTH and peptisase S24 domain